MNRITRIVNEWDPGNLMSHAPDDEYITEVNLILKALKNAPNEDELTHKLNDIFLSQLGKEDFRSDINECREIARKILNQ